jgi:hypothetical protein
MAMVTCMTCWRTATKWPTFEDDPVEAISREVYMMRTGHPRFRTELIAMAALVDAHRDEFEELCNGIDATVSLAERRRRRA